jgi:dTDP-4-dehydrorhamnose 3,5-epimerase
LYSHPHGTIAAGDGFHKNRRIQVLSGNYSFMTSNIEILECKVYEDYRGWVAWPFTDNLLQKIIISQMHVPCLKPGSIRGNHYHIYTVEYMLILSGPCRAAFQNNKTGYREETVFTAEKPVFIKIKPDTIHAFKNIASHDIFLVCFDEKVQTSDVPDIHRCTLLS